MRAAPCLTLPWNPCVRPGSSAAGRPRHARARQNCSATGRSVCHRDCPGSTPGYSGASGWWNRTRLL